MHPCILLIVKAAPLMTIMERKREKVLQDLRTGFKFSILSIVSSFISIWTFPYGLFFAAGIYVYGVIKRSSAWKLLNLEGTCLIMRFGATLIVLCPLFTFLAWYPFYYVVSLFFNINLFCLLIITTWGIYTYVETRAFKKLKENFGIDLGNARICALTGIISAFVTGIAAFIAHMYSPLFVFLHLFSFFFASPFLIASCYFALKRIKSPVDIVYQNSSDESKVL